ncbi:hypothetical protein BS330_36280 [Amycolatopsis keratiniphila subsp. nogabecina]|nr:hypothetical protein BS330_36280 [Amycolatopsis keratiniphila subsp. nogabecina]
MVLRAPTGQVFQRQAGLRTDPAALHIHVLTGAGLVVPHVVGDLASSQSGIAKDADQVVPPVVRVQPGEEGAFNDEADVLAGVVGVPQRAPGEGEQPR